ncbi:MAG: cytochrome c maturation protein CcmE [Pseudomonadota bacterium]
MAKTLAGRKKARRVQMLLVGAVLMAGATGLMSYAFRDTIAFFKSPTELVEGTFREDQRLRLGGLVVEGSRAAEGPTHLFELTDGNGVVAVAFTGVLPDLFREGQGIVAEGYWRGGRFEAVEVLAKHDENYMPKEVADALKEQGHWQEEPGS